MTAPHSNTLKQLQFQKAWPPDKAHTVREAFSDLCEIVAYINNHIPDKHKVQAAERRLEAKLKAAHLWGEMPDALTFLHREILNREVDTLLDTFGLREISGLCQRPR